MPAKPKASKHERLLERQKYINEMRPKCFLVYWEFVRGQAVRDKQGAMYLYAKDEAEAKKTFLKSYNVVGRKFKVTSIKAI